MKLRDFSGVTEVPGNRISAEAFEMMCTRYWFAGKVCSGKDTLEVGCGAGQGLGYLAKRARRVVGGDYTESLLRLARSHYGSGMRLVRLDAHELPFMNASFDVILLYEAIYYLAKPERFLRECRRVLRGDGAVLICTANREWPDFSPSPFSTRYFSAAELSELLQGSGFRVEVRGMFPVSTYTLRDRMVSLIKRAAVKLHLIPKTMSGKELLKRIFLGRLVMMPPEIPSEPGGRAPVGEAISGNEPASRFKVLYAQARLG